MVNWCLAKSYHNNKYTPRVFVFSEGGQSEKPSLSVPDLPTLPAEDIPTQISKKPSRPDKSAMFHQESPFTKNDMNVSIQSHSLFDTKDYAGLDRKSAHPFTIAA